MADVLEMKEIKDWDSGKIDEKVADLRRQVFISQMQQSTGGFEKPHQLKVMKKNIARLLTAKTSNRALKG